MDNRLDAQLDALLDAAEQQGRNPLEIHARIHERKRKRAHEKAKAVQVPMGLRDQVDPMKVLCSEFRKPLTEDDVDGSAGAMDYLLQTIQDTIDAGDLEDTVYALMRIARKAWAWNTHHLGPIEGAAAPSR